MWLNANYQTVSIKKTVCTEHPPRTSTLTDPCHLIHQLSGEGSSCFKQEAVGGSAPSLTCRSHTVSKRQSWGVSSHPGCETPMVPLRGNDSPRHAQCGVGHLSPNCSAGLRRPLHQAPESGACTETVSRESVQFLSFHAFSLLKMGWPECEPRCFSPSPCHRLSSILYRIKTANRHLLCCVFPGIKTSRALEQRRQFKTP